jgi:hypothetical protein
MSRQVWAEMRDLVEGILHLMYVERPAQFAMQSALCRMTEEAFAARTIGCVLRKHIRAVRPHPGPQREQAVAASAAKCPQTSTLIAVGVETVAPKLAKGKQLNPLTLEAVLSANHFRRPIIS